jgi:hypothetical protein
MDFELSQKQSSRRKMLRDSASQLPFLLTFYREESIIL